MSKALDAVISAEIHARLLRRPAWHPARYPGICVTCGEKVHQGDPVILMKTDRGPRWTCFCMFLPGRPLDAKLGALRLADGRTS